MANYRTHATLNLVVAMPVLALLGLMAFHFPYPWIATFVVLFAYGTLFMHPDVDLAYLIKLKSIRGFFSIPFRTYARVFSHRGLSHSFFFGTLTRVVWLGVPALLIIYLIYRVSPMDKAFMAVLKSYRGYFIFGFAGLFLADCCHLILDGIWSLRTNKSR